MVMSMHVYKELIIIVLFNKQEKYVHHLTIYVHHLQMRTLKSLIDNVYFHTLCGEHVLISGKYNVKI